MKIFKFLAMLTISVLMFTGCEKEELTNYVFQEISAPTNVIANFDVSQDDSGDVSITPSGEGAQVFQVYFGDGDNTPVEVAQGESVSYTYDEGEYLVRVVAVGSTGLTSEFNQMLMISFKAPENLMVNVDQSPANPALVTVSASADFAATFDVYFGDAEDEEPTQLLPNSVVEHTYGAPGTYTIRVVAKGAGAATAETTVEVVVDEANDPMKLPVTFDDPLVGYNVVAFGAAETTFEIIDNPQLSGDNPEETKVGAITKTGAAYEGATFNLSEPLDLSGANKTLSVKIYSETAFPVLLKLETGVNDERSNEVLSNHGGTGWETLTFNFATDAKTSYLSNDDPGGAPIVPTGQFDGISLFLDFAGTAAGVYYVDDLTYEGLATEAFKLPVSFDGDVAYAAAASGIGFSVVDNPNLSGANSSATKVGAVTNAGSQYEALTFKLDEAIDFSGANKTITMKVYSETAYPVLFKLETGVNGERANEVEVNHGGTGWEVLTFDFNTARKSYVDGDSENGAAFVPTGQYDAFSIFLDFAGTTAGTFYIDDIVQVGAGDGGTGEVNSEPTAAAPSPTKSQDDVFSIFSDAYTDPAGVNYFPDWGQETTYEMVTIGAGSAIKYSNINYQGIVFGENVDATGYEYVHIDVWSADYTSLPFYLISGSGEKSVTLSLTPNSWNSLNIPLSQFTDQGLAIGDVKEIKFDVQPDNGGVIYIDNLYFYTNGDGGTTGGTGGGTTGEAPNSPIDFETGGFGADWTWSVFENQTNPPLEIVANPSATGINTSATVAKFTALQAGQAYAGVESKRGEDIGDFKFDETNSIVKIMVYKSVISDVGLKFSEASGEAEQEIKVANTKINEWEELTFDLSGSIGKGITGVITQIIVFPDFSDRTQDNVVYFDNITFGSN